MFFNNKEYMIDTNEDNDIIQINDDYQELNEESIYIKDNLNSDQKNSKFFSGSSNSIQLNNYIKNSNIEINEDIDPNFIDRDLKKEEKRRLKEIQEFEKRAYPQNNIIDFDEINNKDDDIEVDEEGIYINNFNYLLQTKKNSFSNKINYKNKIIKNNINKYNKSEDFESKISHLRNNNSYEKDDIYSNNNINKEKERELNILQNKIYDKYADNNKEINNFKKKKEEDININSDINSNYNMDFYDTNRNISKENNSKISSDLFDNLLTNKTFKKFLKNKMKYYMNDKEIPKEFIKNLKLYENSNNNLHDIIKDKLKIRNQSNKNDKSSKNSTSNFRTIDYSNFYNEGNSESINSKELFRNNKLNDKKIYNKSMKNFYLKNNNIYESNNNLHNNYIYNYDKVFIENKINKEKIKDLKKELDSKKNEMNEKINKINVLENMNDNLKNEMNLLQRNFEYEILNNKEAKKNYDIIKSNYTDMKNQYDLLNIKYITLSDENFNYRRDKDLYEKQIKSKNEIIENLLENNSNFKKHNINNKLNKINNDTKTSNIIISDYIKNNDIKNENINIENNKKKKKENEIGNENENKNINSNKFDKLAYPDLQCKRDELIKERKDTYNIYSKIPLKSTSREQINKRNVLEKRIEEINYDLMMVKLKLKNFKNNK